MDRGGSGGPLRHPPLFWVKMKKSQKGKSLQGKQTNPPPPPPPHPPLMYTVFLRSSKQLLQLVFKSLCIILGEVALILVADSIKLHQGKLVYFTRKEILPNLSERFKIDIFFVTLAESKKAFHSFSFNGRKVILHPHYLCNRRSTTTN